MLGTTVKAGGAHARRPRRPLRGAGLTVPAALVLTAMALVGVGARAPRPAAAAVAAPGQGFVVTPGDLKFILKQIKIAEAHAATLTPENPCGTLVGSGPNQIPDRLTSYGLRTVDGSCNNLYAGRETFAAADRRFPRLAPAQFRDAESKIFGPAAPTSYKQKTGDVVDSEPRQTST